MAESTARPGNPGHPRTGRSSSLPGPETHPPPPPNPTRPHRVDKDRGRTVGGGLDQLLNSK